VLGVDLAGVDPVGQEFTSTASWDVIGLFVRAASVIE
jgi:hypothetical protein